MNTANSSRWPKLAALFCAFVIMPTVWSAAISQTSKFAPPPRSIADITAILEQERADPAKRAKAESEADAEPPARMRGKTLSDFYFKRAMSRSELGRVTEAVEDCDRAIKAWNNDYIAHVSRIEQFLETQLRRSGDFKRAVALLERMAPKLDVPGAKGRLFQVYARTTLNYILLGEVTKAKSSLRRIESLWNQSRNWPPWTKKFRVSWQAAVENARARVFAARGDHDEAERAFLKAAKFLRATIQTSQNWPTPPPREALQTGHDFSIASAGRMMARQGRLAEGELQVRRALLERLKAVGKYHPDVAELVRILAGLIKEQSRFAEAEQLARIAIEIYETLGFPADYQGLIGARAQLAAFLFAQGELAEAKEIYASNEAAMQSWRPERSARFRLGWSPIFTNYLLGSVPEGIELARELLERQLALVGEKHVGSATARALLATGLTFAKRDQEAMREFGVAMPIIVAHEYGDGDDDDNVFSAAAQQRLRAVTEVYISLLARSDEKEQASLKGFQLSEMLRNRSLQRALSAAGARTAVNDPALAELARREQDLEKQVGAHIGTLNSLLSLSPEDRDESEVGETQGELEKLRKEHETTRREINRRFPDYGNLIAPKSVTADDIRSVLRSDETFVGFHLGRRNSFVWAVTKARPIAFAVIRMSAGEIEERIDALRKALAPDAATVNDIPQFDVEVAHELFNALLGPVEAAWRPSKSLIVATSGNLGTLPLGLLVTESPGATEQTSQPLFAKYRKVAWLARTHAIAVVPSGASLYTLRKQAASSRKRERFIGFGDPLFNRDRPPVQAPADPPNATTRSLPLDLRASPRTRSIDSASIASLPRLPDTAEELKTIASILEVDPAKALHLGREANEHVVKSMDLSKYRTVAFATHGLTAGELDGLSQPALALSAPEIAGVEGDGLLTMEEILGLKLDADWVVLSACNTSSGADEKAETATGLGRAFFYAGTRALLVTNWSVHTESARDLVADLFRRQRADPKVTRAEALRQAMMGMLDAGGKEDGAGKMAYSYAHPIFWAPYTVIGDGARDQ